MQYLVLEKKSDIAKITINRPEISNALSIELIEEFTSILLELHSQKNIRLLIIQGAGKNFCAGADLQWMKNLVDAPEETHLHDSQKLVHLLDAITNFPCPTLCLVQGATYGGGIGIVAACDIAIADNTSLFCFSETKLGLIPAIISPYVVQAIGLRQTKKLFLTTEVFHTEQALKLGLIHHCTDTKDLNNLQDHIIKNILSSAPTASKQAKK